METLKRETAQVPDPTAENAQLFSPITIRSLTFRNRIIVSPMCEYSSEDGFASDWHLVHLGSRAVGGAALVLTEAIAVEAQGRISPQDLGIYRDEHLEMLTRITDFIKGQGAIAGTQLAHAGRKASTRRPFEKGPHTVAQQEGGWTPVAPSELAFSPTYPNPTALNRTQIAEVTAAFVKATERTLKAGFEVIELHAAHGYLLHQFLSPVANQRSDEYGGSFENRIRFLIEVVDAVRSEWSSELPLFVRLSATDWLENLPVESWRLSDTVELCKILKEHGVDLIDVSSGGLSPEQQIAVGPGYQVPFAEAVRRESDIMTAAVGLITEAEQANQVINSGQADMVALARQLLRDPYWPLRAARELNQEIVWPTQYERAK